MFRFLLFFLSLGISTAFSSEVVWVDVPGSSQQIPVQVNAGGEFEPKMIPSHVGTQVSFQWVSSQVFEGKNPQEICAQVGREVDLLRTLSYPDLMRRRAKDRLRVLSTIRYSSSVAPYFTTPQFMLRLREALEKQGRFYSNLTLSQRYEVRKLLPRIQWSDNAWSKVVGGADSLGDQILRGLAPSKEAIGLGAGEFSGADFYCDLISGRASVVIEVEGFEMGRLVRKELVSREVYSAFMRSLRADSVSLSSRPSDREKNRAYAAFTLGRISERVLTPSEIEYILDSVLEADSGLPLRTAPLEEVVQVTQENLAFSSEIRWVTE